MTQRREGAKKWGMDDYRAAASGFLTVIPAKVLTVIPAKAGIRLIAAKTVIRNQV